MLRNPSAPAVAAAARDATARSLTTEALREQRGEFDLGRITLSRIIGLALFILAASGLVGLMSKTSRPHIVQTWSVHSQFVP
jgi:hypothetical protein